jgi:hypothetical protein
MPWKIMSIGMPEWVYQLNGTYVLLPGNLSLETGELSNREADRAAESELADFAKLAEIDIGDVVQSER